MFFNYKRDGLCFLSAVPKIQWTLTPTVPMAIRLWETFTSFTPEENFETCAC